MSVLSVSFVLLLVCVFAAYSLCPQQHRWYVLLAASLFFYGMAGVGSLLFLLTTSITVYASTRYMQRADDQQAAYIHAHALTREEKSALRKQNQRKRKTVLLLALAVNLGLLLFFKYARFALEQLNAVAVWLGHPSLDTSLRLIVPLGISFYTFQSIGYLVDVYGGACKPQTHYLRLLLFISFFPQIIQGPISTYEELSDTLYAGRTPLEEDMIWGLQRMLWGFMKKMIIANTLAQNTSILFAYSTRAFPSCWAHFCI